MSTLFVTAPGRVAVLSDGDDRGMPISIDGVGGEWFPRLKAIMTGGGFLLEGNVQVTPTLGDLIYGYAFADKITQLRLDGIAFAGNCEGGEDGLASVLDVYRRNKASARETPVQVQIGTSPAGRFRGSLIRLQVDLGRAEDRLSQFSYGFNVFSSGT